METVPSLFELARRRTGETPRVFSRAALVTASHDIEQRYGIQRRAAPLLFGGFQQAGFFASDRPRWERFAAGAALAVVAFGADTGQVHAPGSGLAMLRVGPDDPFWRDWLCLVYAGERRSGMVVARDLPVDGSGLEGVRRCAGYVTHDHRLVRAAAVWVGAYLAAHSEGLAIRWRRELVEVPLDVPIRQPPRITKAP